MKPIIVCVAFAPLIALGATTNVSVGPAISFSPSSVTVAPGDTVQWDFFGFHTTTSNTSTGPEVWDSSFQSSGSFSHTFNTVGDWPYYCQVHSSPTGTAMNGVVHVVAAATTLTMIAPVSGTSAGGTGVTLTGTNFATGCTVDFGGAAGTALSVPNATTITAMTPAHAAGAVTVTVNCPGGSASLTNGFTFMSAPVPAVPLLSRQWLLLMAIALGLAAALMLRARM